MVHPSGIPLSHPITLTKTKTKPIILTLLSHSRIYKCGSDDSQPQLLELWQIVYLSF